MRNYSSAALIAAFLVFAAACSSGDSNSPAPTTTGNTPTVTTAPAATTTSSTTTSATASTSETPAATSTTGTALPSTTTTTLPPERAIDPTAYQMAMIGMCVEAVEMIHFAEAVNASWDDQQAELKAAGKDAQRNQLIDHTDRQLEELVAWATQLHGEILALDVPAGSGKLFTDAELAATAMTDAARAMLDGFRLPARAETVPGTIRLTALDTFTVAARSLDAAGQASLDLDPAPSTYEVRALASRTIGRGLRFTADEINRLWDADEIAFTTAVALFEQLADDATTLSARVAGIEPSEERRAAHGALLEVANQLAEAASAMLAALREEPDQPETGAARSEALTLLRTLTSSLDQAAAAALGVAGADWTPMAASQGPHLRPPDITPPALEVTSHDPGAGVSKRSITIKGRSEPGATVAIGDKSAFADPDGDWKLKINLDRGHNSFTITATDYAGNSTSIEQELHRGHMLSGTRFVSFKLGSLEEEVMDWVADEFGEPWHDEVVHLDYPDEVYGWWANSYFRLVTWQGLMLVFADNPWIRSDGGVGLLYWSTRSDRFVTPEGIHVGSTVEELEASYGNEVYVHLVDEDCSGAGDFFGPGGLLGRVTGPPIDSTSTVIFMAGGSIDLC